MAHAWFAELRAGASFADVAERAEIEKQAKKGISFEMLRWTAAALDHRAGVDPTHLRQKLGVSEVTWQDTEKKLQKLAGQEAAQP